MADPHRIAGHYATGALLPRIKAGLSEAGIDPEAPTPEDLKPVDEFHTGGLEATEALLEPLGITSRTRVVDLGSGIGGTARFIAHRYGAHVTGFDLTPDFVDTAEALSALCGLSERTTFLTASVLDVPAESASFDLATMMHVGMNIENKTRLFIEAARVLKTGGHFALFDIMTAGSGTLEFPVPWASGPDTSFVDPPHVYRDAAASAGLELVVQRNRSSYAVGYFKRVIAATEAEGMPPVGLHLLMGQAAMERYGNAVKAAFDGVTGPWEMVFRKPD